MASSSLANRYERSPVRKPKRRMQSRQPNSGASSQWNCTRIGVSQGMVCKRRRTSATAFCCIMKPPNTALQRANVALQQMVPVTRNFLPATQPSLSRRCCHERSVRKFSTFSPSPDAAVSNERQKGARLAICICRASPSINDRTTERLAAAALPYFAASFALATISAGVA
jgi:hypothetical protein